MPKPEFDMRAPSFKKFVALQKIAQAVSALNSIQEIERVYIFGSVARNGVGNDIDLIIITTQTLSTKYKSIKNTYLRRDEKLMWLTTDKENKKAQAHNSDSTTSALLDVFGESIENILEKITLSSGIPYFDAMVFGTPKVRSVLEKSEYVGSLPRKFSERVLSEMVAVL